jgi:hypothetical protein
MNASLKQEKPMIKLFTSAALAAATAGLLAAAAPAAAMPAFAPEAPTSVQTGVESWQHSRRGHDRRHYRNYRGDRYYGEPIRRNTRTWRGRDGRYYCRRSNGTTGLIIGAAGGALLGRELDGGYDRSTGTILGAAGGALLGRSIDRNNSRCR